MTKLDFSKQRLSKPFLGLFLTLAFLLEVVAFGGFAYVTDLFVADPSQPNILWLVLIIALVIFWSLFMAPKASRRLPWRYYYPVKAIIYAIAAVSIAWHLNITLSLIFAAAALITDVLLYPYRNVDFAKYFGGKPQK